MRRKLARILVEVVAVLMSLVLFGVPFYFVLLVSVETPQEADLMSLAWPKTLQILQNYRDVLVAFDNRVIRAFFNSALITVLSVALLVVVCSMAGFVLQRRKGGATPFINFLTLAGLMIPPAVVPTIWVLIRLGLFTRLPGLILVEVALGAPLAIILYRGFTATVPRDLDESAVMDGVGRLRMFFQILFPLLKPVTSTIIVISSVGIFNDFVNPLYFLPGAQNATVQLTLYDFIGKFLSQWNLLFADVALISLPPLVLFIFFNRQVVAGITAGAIKA